MRKRRMRLTLVIATTAIAAALAGCGSSSTPSTSGTGVPTTGSTNGSTQPAAKVPLRMQLSWTPTSQFAGYLVAKAKGFYDEAGLDVSILPGGPNVNNIQQLVSGAADIAVDRTSTLYAARDKGIPIKAIAEFDGESGFWLVAKKSSGITSADDLKGKKIGIWPDNEFEYKAMLQKMGLDSKKDVETFFQGFTMDPFIAGDYPVAMVTAWNELQTLIESGIKLDDMTIFKPTDYDVGILHGCLVATEKAISANPEALKKFVAATLKGWEYAFENPDEAVQIVLDAAGSGADKTHQTNVLNAMKTIQWPDGTKPAGWGAIPMDIYQENANVVQEAGGVVSKTIDVNAAVDTSIAGS